MICDLPGQHGAGASGAADERGEGQTSLLLALTGIGLLLLPLLLAAALLGEDRTAACGTTPNAHPSAATRTQTSIPATYLALYQQAGRQYGVPWNVLAAVGKVESDHGRYPGPGIGSGTNEAGAAGPMQFGIAGRAGNTWGGTPRHPANQHTGGYGLDGNGDGWADVYDPADAIPAAARYLLAHGAPTHLQRALFAYNHSADYVRTVLAHASHYAAGAFQPVTDLGSCPGDVSAYQQLPGDTITKVLTYAQAQLGKPYVFGAAGPDAFDCSGLVMMAYRAADITIPRTTFQQWHHGTRIQPGAEQPGDLVFFNSGPGSSPNNPGHVGLVYNPQHGLMIVAPNSREVVKIQTYRNRSGEPEGFVRPPADLRPP
jgi:peptidoglycan DL-endopeptidase CwlO